MKNFLTLVDLSQRLPHPRHVPGEVVLQGGAVPPAGSELELALVDRLRRPQTDGVHKGGVALAEVDLEINRFFILNRSGFTQCNK